jgi:transcriptional regulator with XRE-family HTH domain
MPAHEKHTARAERVALRDLAEIGRELRLARLSHDLSQTVAGTAAGISRSAWSRLEHGHMDRAKVIDIARAAAVVGLDLRIKAYPGGRVLRDEAHVGLLERFRLHLAAGARWATEVPLPNAGDKRAWDALIGVGAVRVGIEAETRAHDSQELQRRVNAKQRDGGVDHVILLLADTRHNRAFLRAAGAGFHTTFPVQGTTALQRLAAGGDPGGNAVILL